jgi:alpha-glucosidase (family GH31 glycosyl hydrolase)
MFGSELLVAPITSPLDRSTGLGRVKAWLPDGKWVDIFTGLAYSGGRTIYLHRDLSSIPVLARAGGIIPMTPADVLTNGTALPAVVDVQVFPGADGEFTLVEDRDDQLWARTRMTFDDSSGHLTIHEPVGNTTTLPASRTYLVHVAQDPVSTEQRVFALLDRAQLDFQLKASIYSAVTTRTSNGSAVLALQALDLSSMMLGALTEILLSQETDSAW